MSLMFFQRGALPGSHPHLPSFSLLSFLIHPSLFKNIADTVNESRINPEQE
jgi:hypothetical protein